MFSESAVAFPRDESPNPVANAAPNPPVNKKRKRAPGAAPSPAPVDASGTPGNATETVDLLSARNDLSSRTQLKISRAPSFTPTADGSDFFLTEQLPMNHLGFRYTPAGINPPTCVLPCCTIESNPTSLRVGWEDRSPFVKVTLDGLGLLGEKGFRGARCNAPVREGCWYMEVKVEDRGIGKLGGKGSHVRLGWGRREAPLNGPVGLDGYSYGIRDKTGEKVTLSRPRPYGRPFATGDVIGMYIALPPRRKANQKDPHDPAHIKRERIAIEFKGQEYFESLEYPQSREMISLMDYSGKSSNSASVPSSSKKSATVKNIPDRGRTNATQPETTPARTLPTLPGSHIAFFINGECQGIAFEDIYDYLQLRTTESSRKGKEKRKNREGAREHKENPFDDGTLGYYPFLSLFNAASVRINPGPDFEFPPPPNIEALLAGTEGQSSQQTWRPMSERYQEFMEEQWTIDREEEEAARVEYAHKVVAEKAEAEKKLQRAKKRQQAEERKKAKKAAAELPLALNEERYEPTSLVVPLGQPSPLRYGVAYPVEDFGSQEQSTVPLLGDAQDTQSGYNSDNVDAEGEDVGDGSSAYRDSPHNPWVDNDEYMRTDTPVIT